MYYKSASVRDDARSDVRVRVFWGNKRNAFFEFRVYYPFASSYLNQKPSKLHRRFENARRREYLQRIQEVDDGDFTPMVVSSSGGMGPQMQIALKFLSRKIADKQNEDYTKVMSVMRCKFSFAMARSALICLRGSRSVWGNGAMVKKLIENKIKLGM